MSNGNGRRDFLVAGSAIMGLALMPSLLRAQPAEATGGGQHWQSYRDAMVIDSCGAPGRVTPDSHPLDASEIA